MQEDMGNGTRIVVWALWGGFIGYVIAVAPDGSLWHGGWLWVIGAVIGGFIGLMRGK